MTDKYDSRVRARYVAEEKLSREDVDSYLKGLPDLAENAEWVDYEAQFASESAEGGADADAAAEGAATDGAAEAAVSPEAPPTA